MRSIYTLSVSFAVALSLAACGHKGEGNKTPAQTPPPSQSMTGENQTPTAVYSETDYQADLANLEAAEKALLEMGLKFEKVDSNSEGETDPDARAWRWSDEALGQFAAQNPGANPQAALPALKNYISVADTFVEKYGKPFALKSANGSIEKKQLSEELLADLQEKAALVDETVERLEKVETPEAPTKTPEESPNDSTEVDEEATAPVKPVVPAPKAPVEAPKKPTMPTKPVKPSQPGSHKPVKPAPAPKKPVETPQKPTKPVQPPAKPPVKPAPAKPEKVSCARYMEPLMKKRGYTCHVVGQYSGIDINVSTETRFASARGNTWKHRGKSGVETNYTARVGQYDVPLFTVGIAPVEAQSSIEEQKRVIESCSAQGLKVSTQTRPNRRGQWKVSEVTEITEGRNGLVVTISKPNMRLKLSCR